MSLRVAYRKKQLVRKLVAGSTPLCQGPDNLDLCGFVGTSGENTKRIRGCLGCEFGGGEDEVKDGKVETLDSSSKCPSIRVGCGTCGRYSKQQQLIQALDVSRLGILQKPVSKRGGVGCGSNQLQEVEKTETDVGVVDLGGQCSCLGASRFHDVLPVVTGGEGDGCNSAEVLAIDGCQQHLIQLEGSKDDIGEEGRTVSWRSLSVGIVIAALFMAARAAGCLRGWCVERRSSVTRKTRCEDADDMTVTRKPGLSGKSAPRATSSFSTI